LQSLFLENIISSSIPISGDPWTKIADTEDFIQIIR